MLSHKHEGTWWTKPVAYRRTEEPKWKTMPLRSMKSLSHCVCCAGWSFQKRGLQTRREGSVTIYGEAVPAQDV